jgi:hypothetical protein
MLHLSYHASHEMIVSRPIMQKEEFDYSFYYSTFDSLIYEGFSKGTAQK